MLEVTFHKEDDGYWHYSYQSHRGDGGGYNSILSNAIADFHSDIIKLVDDEFARSPKKPRQKQIGFHNTKNKTPRKRVA